MEQPTKKPKNLLILDGNPMHDWVSLFSSRHLSDGSGIRVIQSSWNECTVVVYPDVGALTTVAPIAESEGKVKRPQTLTIVPDFMLIRNQPRGATPILDNRNTFYGFLISNIPSVNSLESNYLDLERSAMVGQLKAIEKRVGHDKFPLIPITYYSSPDRIGVYDGEFPAIIKVSHAHAGMGKAKLESIDNLKDTATILSLNQDYCTVEPYIKATHGIRVQKIGDNYRVYKKVFTGSGWKSQFGGADLQQIELNDTFKLWADECSKCYGGMDLLAVDAVCDENGKYYILELNGTAIGIQPKHWEEDSRKLVELVLKRMNESFCEKKEIQVEDGSKETAEEWKNRDEERQNYLDQIQLLREEIKRLKSTTKDEEEEKETSSFFKKFGDLF